MSVASRTSIATTWRKWLKSPRREGTAFWGVAGLIGLWALGCLWISLDLAWQWLAVPASQQSPGIGLSRELVAVRSPDPRLQAGSGAGGAAGTSADAAAAAPVFRWQERDLLRRAAGMLLLEGDYEAAQKLLQRGGGQGEVLVASKVVLERVLARLEMLLPKALFEFQVFWDSLPEARRDGLFGPLEPDKRRRLEDLLKENPLAVRLPHCAQAIPERLLPVFARRLHAELSAQTGAHDTFLTLILLPTFPSGSVAALLYERQPAGVRRTYAEAAGNSP